MLRGPNHERLRRRVVHHPPQRAPELSRLRPSRKSIAITVVVGIALLTVAVVVVFVGAKRRSVGDYVRRIASLPDLGAPTYSFDDADTTARARWHLSSEQRTRLMETGALRRVHSVGGPALPADLEPCMAEPCEGREFRSLEVGHWVLLGHTEHNSWFGALYADRTFDVMVHYPD